MLDIKIERTKNPKEKPDKDQEIEFGSIFTDHMFIMDYEEGKKLIESLENVEAQVNSAGIILVKDEATARRMRAVLVREDLIPSDVDPWAVLIQNDGLLLILKEM